MAERHISIPKPFSTGDVTEWFQRFEICCAANTWSDEVKAVKLPMLLEGEALAVWLELGDDDKKDYKKAKEHLLKNMMPMEFISLDEFHQRKLRPGESLSVFLHDLKKLLSGAMPGLAADARKQLLLHQLLAGLPKSISTQIHASGETSDLDKVMERARLLLTINIDNGQSAQTAALLEQINELSVLRDQMALLTDQLAALRVIQTPRKPAIRCFYCNQPGHIQRQCPVYQFQTRSSCRCFNWGKMGHVERDCWQSNQGNSNGTSGAPTLRPS